MEALGVVNAVLRLAFLRAVVRRRRRVRVNVVLLAVTLVARRGRRRRVGMLLAVVSPRAVQLVGRALDDLNLDDWVAPLVAVLGRRRRRDRVNIMLLAVTLVARRGRRRRMRALCSVRTRRRRVRRFTTGAEVEPLGAFNGLRSLGNPGRHGGGQDELNEQVRTHCRRWLLSLPVGRRGVCRIPLLGFCCFFYLNDYLKLR